MLKQRHLFARRFYGSAFSFLGFVASVLWFFVGITWALAEPVRVAVIDAPVDYDNPDIAAFLDRETLNRIVVGQTREGRQVTLDELNRLAMKEFERGLEEGRYREQVRALDLLTRINSGHRPNTEESEFLSRIRVKMMVSPSYRRQLNALGTYLHGTHVAGLVLDAHAPEKVQLVSFPYIRASGQALPARRTGVGARLTAPFRRFVGSFLQGLAATVTPPHVYEEQLRESSRAQFAALTQMLQQGRVRVANMSVGFAVSMILERTLKEMGLINRLLFGRGMERLIRTAIRIQAEELGRFFADNPETIFVVAAGNDAVDVAKPGDHHSAAVGAPNVVNVAATDYNGRLADFSNTSNTELEIAAPGVAIRSVLAGARQPGARVHMSGTSMATPIVTNRIVQILVENPGYTVQEAIAALFQDQSAMVADLRGAVRDGRWLLPRGLAGSRTDVIVSISGVNHEIYFDRSQCERALSVSEDGTRIEPRPVPGVQKPAA
jgi:subtilisin family serine protease